LKICLWQVKVWHADKLGRASDERGNGMRDSGGTPLRVLPYVQLTPCGVAVQAGLPDMRIFPKLRGFLLEPSY
jgi:hypothetical protein